MTALKPYLGVYIKVTLFGFNSWELRQDLDFKLGLGLVKMIFLANFACLIDLKKIVEMEMSLFLCSGYPLTLYGWLDPPHNLSKYNKHSKQFLRTFNTEGGAINPFNCVDIKMDSTNNVCCHCQVQAQMRYRSTG